MNIFIQVSQCKTNIKHCHKSRIDKQKQNVQLYLDFRKTMSIMFYYKYDPHIVQNIPIKEVPGWLDQHSNATLDLWVVSRRPMLSVQIIF